VWDSGAANGHGSSTASFLSSLVASLPPLQEIAKMAGIELPEYLGRMAEPRGDAGPPPPPSRG
jgi:flotillin